MRASSAAFTVQEPAVELSLFQRRCQLSFLGSITSFRLAASACPSQNIRTQRRLCRLEGHSDGVVGSMLPSNNPRDGLGLLPSPGLLSASMIISAGFRTFDSLTSKLTVSTSPPRPLSENAGKAPQSL